jgi:Arc/MetJ-type ribon-helix-helix transcriptional regulator
MMLEVTSMASTRTTVALPKGLLEAMDRAVRGGRFKSRNEFLAVAVRRELERIQREVVDREFEAMADDPRYQREARRIAEEYGSSDWEALRVAEDDS